jgi:tetratricopeptide (TPR) repeat protein
VRLDIGAHDSVSASYNYLHLSNALIQTGFVDEALVNINKSLAYNPDNPYSSWVKVFILYAKNRDLKQARQLLTMELKKDTTKITIMEELGKVCYMMRDYQSAYRYYKKFIDLKESQQLDIFKHESLKIAFVLSKMGQVEKAEEFERIFKENADNDHSIYHHLHLAAYYAYRKEPRKAIEHLTLFSKEDNFQYWILLMEDDPALDPIKDLPEFRDLMREIKVRFWDTNKKIRVTLEEKGLL